jgi:hypothetical protein
MMRALLILVAVCFSATAFAQTAPPQVDGKPLAGARANADDDEQSILAGKAAVSAKLIEPDSARFTEVRVVTKKRQQFVCGFVDAKTRNGAYDGAKPFVFIVNEKHGKHSAIIYGGRKISDDRFSALADPQPLTGICN